MNVQSTYDLFVCQQALQIIYTRNNYSSSLKTINVACVYECNKLLKKKIGFKKTINVSFVLERYTTVRRKKYFALHEMVSLLSSSTHRDSTAQFKGKLFIYIRNKCVFLLEFHCCERSYRYTILLL